MTYKNLPLSYSVYIYFCFSVPWQQLQFPPQLPHVLPAFLSFTIFLTTRPTTQSRIRSTIIVPAFIRYHLSGQAGRHLRLRGFSCFHFYIQSIFLFIGSEQQIQKYCYDNDCRCRSYSKRSAFQQMSHLVDHKG